MKIIASCGNCKKVHIVKVFSKEPSIILEHDYYPIFNFACPNKSMKEFYDIVVVLSSDTSLLLKNAFSFALDPRTRMPYRFGLANFENIKKISDSIDFYKSVTKPDTFSGMNTKVNTF